MRTAIVILVTLCFAVPAQAHRLTHKWGHYLAYRHFQHQHRHIHFAKKRQHRDVVHVGLKRERLPDGQVITVASQFADRFVGFFQALFEREGRLPEIGCYSATGHMRNSLHHWGGACDVGQTSRNVAWKPMYHVSFLAHLFGLTDGAEWRGSPDAGHVEVNRRVTVPRRSVILAWVGPL